VPHDCRRGPVAQPVGLRYSEGLDPESDAFEPELAPVRFDDDAFREVLAEVEWDAPDDEPF